MLNLQRTGQIRCLTQDLFFGTEGLWGIFWWVTALCVHWPCTRAFCQASTGDLGGGSGRMQTQPHLEKDQVEPEIWWCSVWEDRELLQAPKPRDGMKEELGRSQQRCEYRGEKLTSSCRKKNAEVLWKDLQTLCIEVGMKWVPESRKRLYWPISWFTRTQDANRNDCVIKWPRRLHPSAVFYFTLCLFLSYFFFKKKWAILRNW